MEIPKWVRLPNWWIARNGLREFNWAGGRGADNVAALMLLAVVAHHADDTGEGQLTYDQFCLATDLSRAKVAAGLGILCERELIERSERRQSVYRLTGYDRSGGWAILPARALYRNGSVAFFHELHLRARTELDALKLYFLFVARRDRRANVAFATYEQIASHTGVEGSNIKRALSLLTVNGMIVTEQVLSNRNQNVVANAYRIAHVMPYLHGGTIGRGSDGTAGTELKWELLP